MAPSQRVLLLCGLLAVSAIAVGAGPRVFPGVVPPSWAVAWRRRHWLDAAACGCGDGWPDAWMRRWIAEQRTKADAIAGSGPLVHPLL